MSNISDKKVKDLLNDEMIKTVEIYFPFITIPNINLFISIYKKVNYILPQDIINYNEQLSKTSILNLQEINIKYSEKKQTIPNEYKQYYNMVKEQLQLKFVKVGEIFLRIMDLYLLSRIFRKFKDGHETKNIVIYAGQTHSKFYYDFLLKLGFEDLQSENISDLSSQYENIANQEFEDEYKQKYIRKYKEDYEEMKQKKIESIIKHLRLTQCIILDNFKKIFI